MKKLERCPVCGKYPKIRTYDVSIAWVECKPWWKRRAHFKTKTICAAPSDLFDAAIDEWNRLVNCANLPVW